MCAYPVEFVLGHLEHATLLLVRRFDVNVIHNVAICLALGGNPLETHEEGREPPLAIFDCECRRAGIRHAPPPGPHEVRVPLDAEDGAEDIRDLVRATNVSNVLRVLWSALC